MKCGTHYGQVAPNTLVKNTSHDMNQEFQVLSMYPAADCSKSSLWPVESSAEGKRAGFSAWRFCVTALLTRDFFQLAAEYCF